MVIDEVSTTQSEDRTSWGWIARFAADSRAVVRRTQVEPEAVGGVVTARRAALLGLEKAEAWAAVGGFAKAETRSKQGM